MSTRSYVGIIKDGVVNYGYHHSDSHLESLGVELFKSIKTEKDFLEKINGVAKMGSESLRGDFFSVPERDISIEFCYGFDVTDNQWYVSSCHFANASKEHLLTEVVKDDAEMKNYASMYMEEYQERIVESIRENIAS